jgi:acetoin utilization protein AcuB
MKVRDMMQQNVLTVTRTMSLAQVQRLMHDKRIRHLPVVSGHHLVGIITDRDIRDASPSPGTSLSKGEIHYQMDTTPVQTCMSRHVVTVHPDDDMVQAVRILLAHKYGCVPVVEEERLVGLITETDCLQAFLAVTSG